MNSELTQKKDKDPTLKEATCPRMTESRIHHLHKALRVPEQSKKKEGSRAGETKKQTHLVVVRSPVSSLDPADTCPSVTVIAFPPVAAKQNPRSPVSPIWSTFQVSKPGKCKILWTKTGR